jgi:hypothetical protein
METVIIILLVALLVASIDRTKRTEAQHRELLEALRRQRDPSEQIPPHLLYGDNAPAP